MKTSNDMNEVVSRLQAGRKRNQDMWQKEGKRDGANWARHANYADLKEWAGRADCLLHHDLIWDTFQFPDDLEDDINELGSGKRGPAFDYASYAEGWLNGVLNFWLEVEPLL